MISQGTYDRGSGRLISAGGTQRSSGTYDIHQRAAQPPSDQPQPDVNRPRAFDGPGYGGQWRPSDSPADPHDQPFDVDDGGDDFAYGDDGGDGVDDSPTTGPVPDNIVV
jgi:hypothetical protein